jgi:AmiR/NasT family two-component response regulator
MSGRRQIHRSDANQAAIVKALKAIGCSVDIIEEPVDLAVGLRKRTVLMEVKNPAKDWKLTPKQERFFSTFNGEAYIVENEGEALRAMLRKL